MAVKRAIDDVRSLIRPYMNSKAGTPVEPRHAAVLVHDGACAYCRRRIAWIRRRAAAGQFEYVPSQTDGLRARFPRLIGSNLSAGLHVIEPDGTVRVGADAVYAVVRRLPLWRCFAPLYRLSLVRRASGMVYRWIAQHHHRV